MLRRKIDLFLIEWKKDNTNKPLVVYGARQIGKTTSIRQFEKSYKSIIEIKSYLLKLQLVAKMFNWINLRSKEIYI